MNEYLQRMDIAEVEEVTATGQFLKIVEIVEVVDQEGNPWEPAPGPDPWDDLVVVQRTSTSGSTELGSVLTGTIAEYTGGEPPVVEEYQWQRSDTDDGGWSGITSWTETPVLTYTTVLDDNDKYIRFASRATDAANEIAYGSGNAVGPMAAAPLTVTQATKLSNGTFVNPPEVYDFETITMNSAIMGGGYGTITYKYRRQESTDGGLNWTSIGGFDATIPTYDVQASDIGKQMRFQTQAKDETNASKVSSSPATTVGTATTIGNITITPQNTTSEAAGETTMTVSWDGTVVSPMIIWSIRSGPGQIVSPNNMSEQVIVEATGQPGATIQVQVDLSDPSASDGPVGSIGSIIITE